MSKLKKEIEKALFAYHWKVTEIKRLERVLENIPSPRGAGISQYGIESSMPKPQGGMNYEALDAADRRELQTLRRLENLKAKATAIDLDAEAIEDEMESAVIDCVLKGASYRGTAKALGLSRKRVHQIKEKILSQWSQKSHLAQHLLSEKNS